MKRNTIKPLSAAIFASLIAGDIAAAQLDEIIVTARKRDESLQDTPVVVQAFDAKAIERFKTSNVNDLSELVPGLNTDEGTAASQPISLRGIQSSAVDLAVDEAVSTVIDGVQSSSGLINRVGQFDLAQIEVLKGPQALYYGKNSPGGLIVIRTADPTDEFYSRIQAGYEFTNERQYTEAVVSGPLADGWGGRLAALYTDSEGYLDNNAPGEGTDPSYDELNLRGTLKYETDGFDATFKATYYDHEGDYAHTQQIFSCAPVAQLIALAGGDCDDLDNDTFTIQPRNPLINSPINIPAALSADTRINDISNLFEDEPTNDQDTLWLTLEMNYELNDNWSLSSNTGWSEINFLSSGNPVPGVALFMIANDTEVKSVSQEFRLNGTFDNMNVVLGVFADDRSTEQVASLFIPTQSTLFPDTFHQLESDSWSVFAQVEYHLTEKLTASLGGRYTDETKEYRGRNLNNGAVPGPVPNLPAGNFALTPLAGDLQVPVDTLDEDNFSPELSLSYQASDNVLLFGSYREGFKSGSFNFAQFDAPFYTVRLLDPSNSLSENDNSFGPEEVDGFEVGIKTTLLDNSLRLNFSAFSFEYQDLQVSTFDNETSATRTLNAGEASIQGIEVEAEWQASDDLTLFANLAYLDSQYDEFIGDCTVEQINVTGAAGGCNVDVDDNPATNAGGTLAGTGFDAQDRSGDPLRQAPEYAFTVGGAYSTAISDTLVFSAGLTASWQDDVIIGATGDSREVQDSYWLLHGSLGLAAANDSWQLDLIGRNLNDEEALTRAANVPGTPNFFGSRNAPREISLQLTIRPELLFK